MGTASFLAAAAAEEARANESRAFFRGLGGHAAAWGAAAGGRAFCARVARGVGKRDVAGMQGFYRVGQWGNSTPMAAGAGRREGEASPSQGNTPSPPAFPPLFGLPPCYPGASASVPPPWSSLGIRMRRF